MAAMARTAAFLEAPCHRAAAPLARSTHVKAQPRCVIRTEGPSPLPRRHLTPAHHPAPRLRRAPAPARAFAGAELSADLPAALASLDAALHLPPLDASSFDDTLCHLLALADATSAIAPAAAPAPAAPDNGWLAPLVDGLETVLRYFQTGLDRVHVPYSYGWSIVALTASVKLLTLPLTKQQVESQLSMQALKPKIDAIKELYGGDKDSISRETSALYEKAGVNPLAGCLPSLATIPIFIGLYRSLTSVAAAGELDGQGFYWVPSLAGPTSIAAQKAGAGIDWLYPLVDGAPPVGWDLALRYLALPAGVVVAQFISSKIISPPIDPNADNAAFQKALYLALPLMVGWFALNVPSGMSLYYFSNTVFTSAQQIFLRKLGGAKQADFDLGPIDLGKARRTGSLASSDDATVMSEEPGEAPALAFAAGGDGEVGAAVVAAAEAAPAVPVINKRCKRKRREVLQPQA